MTWEEWKSPKVRERLPILSRPPGVGDRLFPAVRAEGVEGDELGGWMICALEGELGTSQHFASQ